MWHSYARSETKPFPVLAVYLAACHHGKVRTVLRATSRTHADVFGVPLSSAPLEITGERWPMDFSIAADGAAGNWDGDTFIMNGPGWTEIVADLLGSHDGREEAGNESQPTNHHGVVPFDEPRELGPFALAYLEALGADRRLASKRTPEPSREVLTGGPPMTEPAAVTARRLPAISVRGLRPTSLGNYLATLGLLIVARQRWLGVRLAWRDGIPYLVGGPNSIDELLQELVACARNYTWTDYELAWQSKQKEGTKAKSGDPVALFRATAKEEVLAKLDAHIVATVRLFFNPLLGSGGNAGKRKFADGWKKAANELHQRLTSEKHAVETENDLRACLRGEPVTLLIEKLQAASWFSEANKVFNSGQNAAREGQISPWAMVLACEGLELFAGAVSRRLGARTRSLGAFPFVIGPAAPIVAGEGGRDRGEVWAPLWARPATLAEVRAIFRRGRAEVGSRGALTHAAFAVATLRRGVDAGLTAFVRFALGATTSSNTFEPRLLGQVMIPQHHILVLEASGAAEKLSSKSRAAATSDAQAEAVERVLDLWETLPRDTKKGQRWQFRGLRGPIESALVSLAEKPRDAGRACTLTDAIVATLDRIDRNHSFREASVRWRPLPLDWLPVLLGEAASIEARLATAIISGFPARLPFALYRFGVDLTGNGRLAVTERPPSRWVWGSGLLATNLIQILRRRTLDLSRDDTDQSKLAVRQGWPVSPADFDAWFNGAIDEDLVATWLGRLALFDWRHTGLCPTALKRNMEQHFRPLIAGALSLHALLLPLLDRRRVPDRGVADLLSAESDARTGGVAQTLVALLSVGNVDDAIRLARARYAMGSNRLADFHIDFTVEDPRRLAAGLLIPISDEQRARLIVQRWLRPSREKGELRYAYV
jgi:CRISPR-associated protein Csx17